MKEALVRLVRDFALIARLLDRRGTTAATFVFPPMRDGTPHIPGS